MLNTKNVIMTSRVQFGTSGLRGLVEDFTNDVCNSFITAFISILKERYSFDTIAVGIDNRPSSPSIAKYCINSIESRGFKTIYCGVLPTPALANYCFHMQMPGVMITGSHIPFDRNGIKFYLPDGEITKEDEYNIFNYDENILSTKVNDVLPQINEMAVEEYIKRYVSIFPSNLLEGKRIGIYEHSSAGRDIYKHIFKKLGATVVSLGRSDFFVPIDTEAVSHKDCKKAVDWSRCHQLDAIFSTDGDGDRPLLADNNGQWLRGDVLGLLCSLALKIEAVATPINCNSMIEIIDSFPLVHRTKIGSPFVLESIASLKSKKYISAGFEANGGFILASAVEYKGKIIDSLPTRDALLPAIVVLASAYDKKINISTLISSLPRLFTASDRLQNFSKETSKSYLAMLQKEPSVYLTFIGNDKQVKDVNLMDGIRITYSDNRVIHVRASGNAPELRCYCESYSLEDATELVRAVLEHAGKYSNYI